MIVFGNPLVLFLLALLPPLFYFRHFYLNRGGRVRMPFVIWPDEPLDARNPWARLLAALGTSGFWAAMVLIILALAGPARVERQQVFLNRGTDILFVLDESPSMAARDFLPDNRFGTARRVIKTFVEGRENDPVGLVTFGREAVLRQAPTLDYDSFYEAVDSLSIMDLGNGTAIGMGLAVGLLHLNQSESDRKVVILLTDGENNAGEISPEIAVDMAQKMGIRIYTLGIGTRGEVPVEFRDPRDGKIYRGAMKSGYDQKLLESIAERTGGRFFSASSPGTLEGIFRVIDSLEAVENQMRTRVSTFPIHRTLILWALALFLFEILVRRILFGEVW